MYAMCREMCADSSTHDSQDPYFGEMTGSHASSAVLETIDPPPSISHGLTQRHVPPRPAKTLT